jgi:hypothetical protein
MLKVWITAIATSLVSWPMVTALSINQALAAFDGLDHNCRPAPNAPEEWLIKRTYKFTDRGKNYKLIYSSTMDGGGSICLMEGKSAKPLGLKYWKDEYLDRVDFLKTKVFTFQIHQGNGNNVPYKKYRLDLTQPQSPKVTLVREWIDS